MNYMNQTEANGRNLKAAASGERNVIDQWSSILLCNSARKISICYIPEYSSIFKIAYNPMLVYRKGFKETFYLYYCVACISIYLSHFKASAVLTMHFVVTILQKGAWSAHRCALTAAVLDRLDNRSLQTSSFFINVAKKKKKWSRTMQLSLRHPIIVSE